IAVNAWYNPGDEPTRPAHLDDRDHRAVLVQRNERSAQIIPLWHGALHRWLPATMVLRLAARPIASVMIAAARCFAFPRRCEHAAQSITVQRTRVPVRRRHGRLYGS